MARCDLQDEDLMLEADDCDGLIALDVALTKLAATDAELAELVQLRYFTGLTIEQTAEVLGISPRTTKRHWSFARAWLRREIEGGG